MTVADTPDLAGGFTSGNLARMREGMAPIAHRDGWYGQQRSMAIHLRTEIYRGGGVYDMSNMQISTPKFHNRIHYVR